MYWMYVFLNLSAILVECLQLFSFSIFLSVFSCFVVVCSAVLSFCSSRKLHAYQVGENTFQHLLLPACKFIPSGSMNSIKRFEHCTNLDHYLTTSHFTPFVLLFFQTLHEIPSHNARILYIF